MGRITGKRVLLVLLVAFALVLGGGSVVNAGDIAGGVESAFKSGNAGALGRHMPAQGRIHLSIPSVGIKPGDYSKSQAIALIRKMFSTYQTTAFSLDSRSTAIRAEWSVRSKSDQATKSLTLYVSVIKQDGKNVINSIRGN